MSDETPKTERTLDQPEPDLTLAEKVELKALSRIPGSDLEEGSWNSLPADSEASVDYPKPDDQPITHLRQIPGVIDQFELPAGVQVGDFTPELVVTMTVMFPDGSMWEHTERTPDNDDIDVMAQADTMVDEVSQSMAARVKRIVL